MMFNRERSLSEFIITRTRARARARELHLVLVLLLVLMFGRINASRRKFRHLDAPIFIFATNIQVLIVGKIYADSTL